MEPEFTNEDFKKLIRKYSNQVLSIELLAKIVYDSRFPQHLFEKANIEIQNWRNDKTRWNELNDLIKEKRKVIDDLNESINKATILKQQLKDQLESYESEYQTILGRLRNRGDEPL